MAGSKYQYDESGGTFFYFLLSFLAFILVSSSYYFWPNWRDKDDEGEKTSKQCHCERCQLKRNKLIHKEPWKKRKQYINAFLIVLGWLAFAATAYKVSHLDRDYVDWDPFAILEIDRGATTSEIKRAYHRLSLLYHPDKQSGDSTKFLQLTKAHAALTDEESRKNWQLYGDPDGPGAMSLGIALPSWIVEKENSIWVLGLYATVFMVALPTVVWIWWRRSIQYGGDQILMDTTKLYRFYVYRSPNMNLKRLLMVLAGSMEFWKRYNNEVVERPSDNLEIPVLFKNFANFGEVNKKEQLCSPYSVKARALLFAHLHRMEQLPTTIEQDRLYIVRKCPSLIHELLRCISEMIMLAMNGHVSSMPPLDTLENCMRLSPMLIQALWDNKNPLLQLPHIQEDMLRHFVTKTRNIKSIRQLVSLKAADRRSLLRTLSDEEYEDVMNVCSKMPHVDMVVKSEVLDDDKPQTITAGAIVTVKVFLVRRDMETQFGQEENENAEADKTCPAIKSDEETGAGLDAVAVAKKAPVWKKQSKKKGKSGSGKQKKKNTKKLPFKKLAAVEEKLEEVKSEGSGSQQVSSRANDSDSSSSQDDNNRDSDSESDESRSKERRMIREVKKGEKEGKEEEEKDGKDKTKGGGDDDDDDDEEAWQSLQAKLGNKETNIDGKSHKSHSVHCPFFPDDKQEYWWLYIVDQKLRIIQTLVKHVTDLKFKKEVTLEINAPHKVGVFNYTVHLRSDSYIGSDVSHDFKLDVKSAPSLQQVEEGNSEDGEEDDNNSDSDVLNTDDDDLNRSDDD